MLMGDWAGPPQARAISIQWVGPEGTKPEICGGIREATWGYTEEGGAPSHTYRELPSLRKLVPAPPPRTPRQVTTAAHTLTWPDHNVCNTLTQGGATWAGLYSDSRLQVACPTGNGGRTVSWHKGPKLVPHWAPVPPAHTWAGHTDWLAGPSDTNSLAHVAGLEVTPAADPDAHAGGRSRACRLVPRQPV